jgi:nitrogen-specific signal transduction histidine kinase
MSENDEGRTKPPGPDTFFAPAERAGAEVFHKALAVASHNPVIDAALRTFGGMVAVLNEQRQILAVNHALLESLGIADAAAALGLRPGEAAGCVYAHEGPGGCGTGPYCSNCGAVIAILAALDTGVPQQRECALTVERDGRRYDITFVVRCCPVTMEGVKLVLLFLRDVSEEKRRGALELTFFHDVKNLLSSLSVAGDLLAETRQNEALVKSVRQAIAMLVKEVEVQQALAPAGSSEHLYMAQETSVGQILERVRGVYATHPTAVGRRLTVEGPAVDVALVTDPGLAQRVLMNLITNAMEATPAGGEVRMAAQADAEGVWFRVWNRQPMTAEVARRVFQRYFTTKPGVGRGFGTFAAKWLAEQYLKGELDFVSTPDEGTMFRLRIPLRP